MNEKLDQYKASAQPIREAINSRPLTDFYHLEKSQGGLYVCPVCGSGTHHNKTGALSIRKNDNRVTCFGSGHCFGEKGSDTLGALRILHPGKSEQEIFTLCGYHLDGEPLPARAETQEKPTPQVFDFRQELDQYAAALPGSEGESYLQARGLTVETMQRFHMGYDSKRHCVTFPYNTQGSYYGRRSTQAGATRPHDNLKGVTMPLFNAAALYNSDVCFVVESPLCAISISQEGGAAVAISGTSGKTRLIEQLKKKPTPAALVLCLDNDDAGRKATEDIDKALEELDVFHVDGTSAITGDRKDPNEVLQKDGAEALREAVRDVVAETRKQQSMTAHEAEAERQERTGAGMVDTFLQDVQSRKYEPMPTGIRDIDNAIGGGFIRQQLVLLGAAPGVGKTALAQWIFEGMAKRGITTVYLNLEMSREQILARSISRIAAAQGNKIKTTTILQGYKWTDAQRAEILAAAEEYKTTIAPRMIYNPDGVTANLGSIIGYIEAEAQRAEKAGLPAPCVVLDYLQIVSGEPREDAASVIKRAVIELKKYAMQHNALVFVIIAHNRSSNATGNVSMESGRDTSALEYSADLQLALTFTKCLKRKGQDKKDPDELNENERRYITMRIVKGRFGGMGREVDLFFNGETMTMTQMLKGAIEVDEPTPFTRL